VIFCHIITDNNVFDCEILRVKVQRSKKRSPLLLETKNLIKEFIESVTLQIKEKVLKSNTNYLEWKTRYSKAAIYKKINI
jgi:hypothetical protein